MKHVSAIAEGNSHWWCSAAETARNKQVIDPLVWATHFERRPAKEKKGCAYISIHLHIWPPVGELGWLVGVAGLTEMRERSVRKGKPG